MDKRVVHVQQKAGTITLRAQEIPEGSPVWLMWEISECGALTVYQERARSFGDYTLPRALRSFAPGEWKTVKYDE